MGKKILHYFVMNPFDKRGNSYVKATYTDGSMRVWYPRERGYKSARAKALTPLYRTQIH